MKKTYEKPQIMFESFTLSTNIAGDCEVKTWEPTNSDCGMKFSDGLYLFIEGVTGCSVPVVDGTVGNDDFNTICYHVPFGNNLFNS